MTLTHEQLHSLLSQHTIDNDSTMHVMAADQSAGNDSENGGDGHLHGIHVVAWKFEYVAHPLLVLIFVMFAMFLKLGK